MKLNNLATRAGLCSMIALMFATCQSDTEQLNQLNSEIDNLETQINKTYNFNEATDSAANNPTLQMLGKWIQEDSPRIASLRERSYEVADSIRNAKIQRVARNYPLSKFLSRDLLKTIQKQLRHGCSYYSEPAAKRIINGRGTLFDLYTVSFEIGFEDLHPGFRIIDPIGTVRFGDKTRDALCIKFDKEIYAIYTAPQSNKEILANQKELDAFDHKIEIYDNIYTDIQNHFQPQISHRIDSLRKIKEAKCSQRDALLFSMRERSK